MYYNAKDKLPSPSYNGYSNGCRGNIILMKGDHTDIVQSTIFYDHNNHRWLDWHCTKDQHKPVLVEQINDEVIQRVLDWEDIGTDSYKITEDYFKETDNDIT